MSEAWQGYYLTAYAIAVKHGYTGTEEEWIREVHDNAAASSAKAAGYASAAQEQAEAAEESKQAAAQSAAAAAQRAEEIGDVGDRLDEQDAVLTAQNGRLSAQEARLAQQDRRLTEQDAAIETIQLAVGSPLAAATVAGMTDQTKIYVYTGSETGYTAGNWYYWNGTAWTSGGVYNSAAVQTDTTLLVSGKPADAAVVGTKLTDDNTRIQMLAGTVYSAARVSSATESGLYELTAGGIQEANGKNATGTSDTQCKTGFITISEPYFVTLGLSAYKWTGWSYSSGTATAGTHSDSDGAWISGTEPIYVPKPAADKYFRVAFKRADGEDLTTDTEDSSSDWYILQHALRIGVIEKTDTTLALSGKSADSKTVGDLLFRGRTASDLTLDAMAKYTGTITESVEELPDNTWCAKLGSVMKPLLGDGFTWSLNANTTYACRKTKVATSSVRYELAALGGPVLWTGYTISGSTAIVWSNLNERYKDITDGLTMTGVSVTDENYAASGYANVNEITDSCIVRYAASVTDQMVPGLPEYGRPWVVMTLRYTPTSVTASSGKYGRLQLAWSTKSSDGARTLCYRVSYTQSSSSWGPWLYLGGDGLKPVYVAIGTSVTRGEIHASGQTTTISDYPYPQYFGQLANLDVHNLAQGGTGLVSRYDGTKQNFMDVITANTSLIQSAKLVTIEWGGNDSGKVSFGTYTDYFKYEDYAEDYDGMLESATELGALNWCIKKIYDLNPKVTLILICGTGYPRYLHATVDENAGTVTYSAPADTTWSAKVKAASRQLREATGIPTINCDDGYVMTAYNNDADDDGCYLGHDGVHPTNDGYLMKARFLAGEIGKFFTH